MTSQQVEQVGENRVRLTVEVPPGQVQHAVEHALADLSESVKIPGFRKGKIPEQVLISRLGKDRIYGEAVDSHIGGWFWSAAARNRLRPIAQPQYEFELPATQDDPWTFQAIVDVQPIPEIVDWATLEVPRPEADVPTEVVDAELEAVRESVAELVPADERPARDGDTVVVDLVDPSGEAQRDTVLELGSSRLVDEVEQALLGASIGDTKHATYELADGSTAHVDVTLKEIKEKVLPPLDDDLAKAASEFDTLAELRADLEERLGEQLEAEIDQLFRMAAVDELVLASEVKPAAPLVQQRASELLTAFVRSLERRGLSAEAYLQIAGRTGEQLQSQMILEAAQSLARELALDALAARAGIEVSDDAVRAYVGEQAAEAGEDPAELVAEVWAHGQEESIREDLRLRAALDRLVADVTPIDPELAAAREKLWTPDKESAPADTKLWTPGHPASQDG